MAQALEDVFVNHEALIFRRGRIYRESFVRNYDAALYKRASRYGRFLVKNYWLRRGAVTVPSGLWVIDNFSPGNYYHWMVECLPRLLQAEERYPDEHVLLLPRYYRKQPFIPFTLQAFPRISQVGWIGARTKTRVKQLAFVPRQPAPVVEEGGDFRPEQIAEIARRVKALAEGPGSARRIYFSRADARRRRVVSEPEVVRVLRSHDFEIVRVDPSRPAEQIRLSRGASLIVGAHGAALTNLMFMSPGGRVLELRRHAHHDPHFFDGFRLLAEATGIDYYTQTCEVAQEAAGFEINQLDLIVDLDMLRENLRNVIRDRQAE